MMPIGPLMVEHRWIERVIADLKRRLDGESSGRGLDSAYVERLVDFLRTYADRYHHDKEEDHRRRLGHRGHPCAGVDAGGHRAGLASSGRRLYHDRPTGALSSGGERFLDAEEAVGSNPTAPTRSPLRHCLSSEAS